ncbi:transposase [Salinibacter ruber]|uniref:transposase n=1 Tax=Salinibacter ruber TaxID=146919 RepID=UPI003C6E950C
MNRSLEPLVLTLVEMLIQGVGTRGDKKGTTELRGRKFSKSTASRRTKNGDRQIKSRDEQSIEGEYPILAIGARHVQVRRQGGVRSAGRKYLQVAELRNWKGQAHRSKTEPSDSAHRQRVLVPQPNFTQLTFAWHVRINILIKR